MDRSFELVLTESLTEAVTMALQTNGVVVSSETQTARERLVTYDGDGGHFPFGPIDFSQLAGLIKDSHRPRYTYYFYELDCFIKVTLEAGIPFYCGEFPVKTATPPPPAQEVRLLIVSPVPKLEDVIGSRAIVGEAELVVTTDGRVLKDRQGLFSDGGVFSPKKGGWGRWGRK